MNLTTKTANQHQSTASGTLKWKGLDPTSEQVGHTVYPSKLFRDTADRTWGGDVFYIYIEYDDIPTTYNVFVM